jgi:translation elongation factor EF-Ts
MSVTPAEVKKLRDATDAGMLDCKKHLLKRMAILQRLKRS